MTNEKTDKEVPFPGRVPVDFAWRIVLFWSALPKKSLPGGLINEVYRFNSYLRQQLSRIDFASIRRCPLP